MVRLLGLLDPELREAMTVVRAGGREDEVGRLRSHWGTGEEGRLAGGIGVLRLKSCG